MVATNLPLVARERIRRRTASDDRADYAATQIVAELFRQNGFDGIAYRSSSGPGHNIALFDLNAANVAPDRQLVEVTDLCLKYSQRYIERPNCG